MSDTAEPDIDPMADFRKELTELINRHSIENGSDTPDFIIADYLMGCLEVYEVACRSRDVHYEFGRFGQREPKLQGDAE